LPGKGVWLKAHSNHETANLQFRRWREKREPKMSKDICSDKLQN
jgi:hypothetical protein